MQALLVVLGLGALRSRATTTSTSTRTAISEWLTWLLANVLVRRLLLLLQLLLLLLLLLILLLKSRCLARAGFPGLLIAHLRRLTLFLLARLH